MSLLSIAFYSLAPLFIFVELFQLIKRDDIYSKLKVDHFETKEPIIYIAFYILRLAYIPWIFTGLFTKFWLLFCILILIGNLKYYILFTGKLKLINIYDIMNCLISVLILGFIFYSVSMPIYFQVISQ